MDGCDSPSRSLHDDGIDLKTISSIHFVALL